MVEAEGVEPSSSRELENCPTSLVVFQLTVVGPRNHEPIFLQREPFLIALNNRFQLFNAFRLIDTPFSTPPEKVEKDACYYVLSSKSQFFVGIYKLKQVFLRGQPT
ncbi:hypothetical protein A946_10165 [Methylacidiphilum kamchatkense Kam1]|uniref:Uncharacterized protein n=1 Tax=Methylacidiphilum kamchatkense Kam1 TaxID=1202785 RepID=A0ABR4ZV95_9BACT|nr:hypothetical protein A946_10165 [Methylacidiphilum kamchatkense Kam1]